MFFFKQLKFSSQTRELLLEILSAERSQFVLWLPVLFGIGIAIYFSLSSEPTFQQPIALSTLLGSLILILRRNSFLVTLLFIAVMVSGGFGISMMRANQVAAPVIADEWKKNYDITANVERVEMQDRGMRVWLDKVVIKRVQPEWTPERIRLSVNTNMDGIRAGDRVDLRAVLYPPPLPAMPGAYDFARQAYFEQIGAVGYSVSAIKLQNRPDNWHLKKWLADLRQTLAERIRNHSASEDVGNVAAGLLVGDRGAIKKRVMEQMRDAGLAHLLAISGLHLALVAAICFFMVRLLLALSSRMALKHPIKQYAAAAAIVFSFFYLMITGAPISAQRAFIMTGLVLSAVLLNRSVTPLRSIALAAFLVLLFTPESLLSPSFQMSFAAAGALIASFEVLRKPMGALLEDAGVLRRASVYVIGVLLSSLVAGFATAPFALYHFSHMSSYSLLANLVAVPLTSLWIMPWGVAAFALMPFGFEALALYPMGVGIDVVMRVAEFVSALPNANPPIQALPMASLACISVGMLWLALWKTKLRLLGVLALIPAVVIALNHSLPDILVNEDGRMLAFRANDGMYDFPAKTSPNFVRESWLERLGQDDYRKLKENISSESLTHEGDRNYLYNMNGKTVLFAHDKAYAAQRCKDADYFVDMFWYEIMACDNAPTLFNRQDLELNGTHIIFLGGEGEVPRVEHVRGYRGERKW